MKIRQSIRRFRVIILSPPAVRDSQGTADGRVRVVVGAPGEDAPGCVGDPVQLPYLCYMGQAETRRCGSQAQGQEPGS